MMSTQSPLLKQFVLVVVGLFAALSDAEGQALTVAQIEQGPTLVVVTMPMADATTLAWRSPAGGAAAMTSGALTLASDLEHAFSEQPLEPAPAVVVAVGQASPDELRSALARLLAGVPVATPPSTVERPPADGAVDRRLGPPGSTAALRLELALPSPDDWQRASAEVLWQLVPQAIGIGAGAHIVGERAVLDGHTDAEFVDSEIRRWRLALARFAEDPALEADAVEAARRRVAVRRQAQLAEHPEGAEVVLDSFVRGGAEGVRQLLFGIDAVTPASVREVARGWLAGHSGAVVVTVPPQVLNPRFATPPQRLQLDNDLAAAVLERPATPLAALVLRPVLTADVDGTVAATVLTRIAAEMRAQPDNAAGWIRAERQPARLELAATGDEFAELIEGLQAALDVVAMDRTSLAAEAGGDARRAALALVAQLLGLGASGPMSPADLLRPDNLALGIVAGDGETVVEALRKFRFGGAASPLAAGATVAPSAQRTRIATAGKRSWLAVVLPVAGSEGDLGIRADVLAALLAARAPAVVADLEVEALRPFVPGREVIVLLVAADGPIDVLEGAVRAAWQSWLVTPSEDELTTVRRRVAAAAAAAGSGAVGRARLLAAVAAGAATWRTAAERELAILTVGRSEMVQDLDRMRDFEQLVTAGAGVLPIVRLAGTDAVP